MTDKNTLKNWFRNGLKPTQEQFWAWQDSYFHKSEKIPQTQIEGLGDSLANKADASQIPSNIATVDSGDVEGNVHTKEQIAELLENSGKNMANTDLTTTGRRYFKQEHEYVWFTNRSTFLMGSDNSDGVYSTLLLNKTGVTLINDKGQGNEVRFSMSEGLFRFSGLKEGVTNTHNYVMAVDDSGIVAKLPAGDLGKNMSNSQVTTTALGGVTQGYNYTWDTAGYYLYFKGLPDKSNDTTFNKVVVRDSNGQLAESNGKQLLLSMPTLLNAQERTRWFSQFNDLVSWSGSSVRLALPPVISRNEKHQNILISGLGLNLVGNTAGTPEYLKSYVGLIAPDGSKINSSNYGIVGNNQQVYGEFLINNEKPLGDYKVDIKNAGVDAVGDVYVKVVDALTPLSPQLSFSTRTINGQSADNVMADEIDFTIGSNSSIKQLYNGDWRAQVFDTVSIGKSNDVLSGQKDWQIDMSVSLDGLHQMISANNVPMARLGLGVGESFVYSLEFMNYLHSKTPVVNLSRNINFSGNQNISGMLVSIVKSGNILKIFYSFKDFSDMAVYTIDTTRNYNVLGVFSNTYLKGTMRCSVIKSIQF